MNSDSNVPLDLAGVLADLNGGEAPRHITRAAVGLMRIRAELLELSTSTSLLTEILRETGLDTAMQVAYLLNRIVWRLDEINGDAMVSPGAAADEARR